MQEAVPHDGREAASVGPTLFDFQNPLELRVETFEERADHDDTGSDEPGSWKRSACQTLPTISLELARLLDGSSASRSTDEALTRGNPLRPNNNRAKSGPSRMAFRLSLKRLISLKPFGTLLCVPSSIGFFHAKIILWNYWRRFFDCCSFKQRRVLRRLSRRR